MRINGIYHADNCDLNIRNSDGQIIRGSHDVIVTSVNKKNGTCRVKTITSIEERRNSIWHFKNDKLNDVKKGNLLIIPKSTLNFRHLSAINHNSKTIKINKLYYSYSNLRYPNRYDKLINRK